MLIVTADDWGLRPEVTDAIAACWRAGAVTRASAMVGMEDSERAFALAAAEGLPLGLHLNLTTPFTGAAPAASGERQAAAVAYFARPRRRLVFDPFARARLDACVADQLQAFAAAAGAPPRHADGHQHIQTCPTVLASAALGRVESLREAHAFVAGRRSRLKWAYRAATNAAIRRRFRSHPFVSLRDVHPALGGAGLGRLRELAGNGSVEVMTHPAWEDERELLLSAEWLELVAAGSIGAATEAP